MKRPKPKFRINDLVVREGLEYEVVDVVWEKGTSQWICWLRGFGHDVPEDELELVKEQEAKDGTCC
ncbi:MAG: hypothetical protein UT24_C0033G0008 [Candidatus Woesebacteria bacterium GW2011_GWB1_39_12]|uniref:Uncharacterized protein n=1 Tax=Candidatus Woesebacteria bacterium GW2011_GWB1_39_12 TaxID=1618574 RepID=A0A0G0M3V8_9BACT|nr:MAG: hypothetical protein UT24_C0033G0008 [Candidatus Woesebacteria bacterium GW2011_GWB1_39_12]